MPDRKSWLPFTIIICIAVIGFAWRIPSFRHNAPFRDLNKNGKLDVYEDPKQAIDARINDLLKQMTLEEKVAQVRSMWAQSPKIDETLLNDPLRMDSLFKNGMGMLNPDLRVLTGMSITGSGSSP